jgi:hypothetical protein
VFGASPSLHRILPGRWTYNFLAYQRRWEFCLLDCIFLQQLLRPLMLGAPNLSKFCRVMWALVGV